MDSFVGVTLRLASSQKDFHQRRTSMHKLALVLALSLIGVAPAHADLVTVTASGQVLFNGITTPPLNAVTAGQTVGVLFTVDSNNFLDGVPGDTRGYVIDQPSFTLAFSGGVTMGLLNPFPAGQTPYFTLVEGFPVSDGFFVSTSPLSPGGVPLAQTPYQFNLDLGYVGTTLASLNILDALGTYGFGGLTRFSMGLWQGFPDNVRMEIDFRSLTISQSTVAVGATTWGRVKSLFHE